MRKWLRQLRRAAQHYLRVLLLFDLVEQLVEMVLIDVAAVTGAAGIENLVRHALVRLAVDGEQGQVIADPLLVNLVDLFVLLRQDVLPKIARD